MKGKHVCDLPTTASVSDADSVIITRTGGKAIRLTMKEFRAYVASAVAAEIAGLPAPSLEAAGRTPVVKQDGSGYDLEKYVPQSGGEYTGPVRAAETATADRRLLNMEVRSGSVDGEPVAASYFVAVVED